MLIEGVFILQWFKTLLMIPEFSFLSHKESSMSIKWLFAVLVDRVESSYTPGIWELSKLILEILPLLPTTNPQTQA